MAGRTIGLKQLFIEKNKLTSINIVSNNQINTNQVSFDTFFSHQCNLGVKLLLFYFLIIHFYLEESNASDR